MSWVSLARPRSATSKRCCAVEPSSCVWGQVWGVDTPGCKAVDFGPHNVGYY
ncbi:hypothetical protein HNR05_001485 [Leifsonia psychrotolerans]|uniref:Uncharacterized protein n=1 Tax=Glaciibacter psychrotolerans TaxID=670054 RepID=A0A7Z0EEV3_9MICO|nr:hypothetical protein [Leifsonia psychrotolerans]